MRTPQWMDSLVGLVIGAILCAGLGIAFGGWALLMLALSPWGRGK